MSVTHLVLLLIAGLLAGAINAVAGGGSLITFPALIGVGLGQVDANVTNSVAVSPGYVSSVYGTRTELRQLMESRGRRTILGLLPTAAVGSAAGCALLLGTPAKAFTVVVPFLVLAATAVLAFQTKLRKLVGHPRDMSPRRRVRALHLTAGFGAIYGGYFGAALGVMFVAAFGLVLDEPLVRVNALKNLISAMSGAVSVVAFAIFGHIDWVDVAIVAPATIVGGYTGGRIARHLPAPVLQGVIVTVGTVIGIILLIRALG